MRLFYARLFSYKKTLISLVAGGILPYLGGLLRDELVLRGFGAAWDRVGGLGMLGDWLAWMAAHPLQSVTCAVLLYLVVAGALSQRFVKRSLALRKPLNHGDDHLARVTVTVDGFPEVILREGDNIPRFILLPSVAVANGNETAVSLSFGLRIQVHPNRQVEYAALGEELPSWEVVKQMKMVEHVHPRLTVPLDLPAKASKIGYLTFHYMVIWFTDANVADFNWIDVKSLAKPQCELRVFVTELHSGATREFPVGMLDVRKLVLPWKQPI